MITDTVNHNGMDQPFLESRKLWLLVGAVTTNTEPYICLDVWKQLKNHMTRHFNNLYHIARRVGYQGVLLPVGCQAGVEKSIWPYRFERPNLKMQKKTLFSTLNCWGLNSSQKKTDRPSSETQHWHHMHPRTSDLPRRNWHQIPRYGKRLGLDHILCWKSYQQLRNRGIWHSS